MRINRQDTNGVKPLLQVGELGYDNWSGGGDVGRVYVGNGASNLALAKKSEVDTKVVANVNITAGTATKVTYDAKGLVTSGTNPTTLSGYGITDADTSAQVTTKINNAVAALVDASPTTLDTLNELAAALGDDPNFATTTANNIAAKVAKVTSTDNAIVRFDGITGAVQNSGVIIDDSGNVGIGVTPSASSSLTIQSTLGIILGNDESNISNNAYYSSGWKYVSNGYANLYSQSKSTGSCTWFKAPSGTAGNAITWTNAMTLDASGNLSVGGVGALRGSYGSGGVISNLALGNAALQSNTTGQQNTASGVSALQNNTTGSYNTASGVSALLSNTIYSNVSGFGYNSQVTGSNQVQLGDANTTTYVYGTVQNRSDIRDKADVRDTTLGLEFIQSLRPVDYKWDMREDYKPERPDIEIPAESDENYEELKAEYDLAMEEWLESCKLENIVRDGSKIRSRYHQGFIAQEVLALDVEFGGIQDHKLKGGDDVLSVGYDEMIAPLVKAIQEQQEMIVALQNEVNELKGVTN